MVQEISVIIIRDKKELYRADFNGSGDKAVKLGIIDRDGYDFVFRSGLVGLSGVKEKTDPTKSILK